MKFGSVEFFKSMIKASLLILPISLVLLISVTAWFVIYHMNSAEQIRELEARIEQLESAAALEADISLGQQSGSIDHIGSESLQYETSIVDMNNNQEVIDQLHQNSDDQDATPVFDFLPDFWLPMPDESKVPVNKTAYLTFDDGPSHVTMNILDTLDQYNIKATFFVVSRRNEFELNALREAADRGHSIGMHSGSHDPEKMYSSVEEYLTDMYDNFKYVYESTGIKPQIFRFVGGSRSKYNNSAASEIIEAMSARGFSYFDWNSSADDAMEPHPNAAKIVSNVLRTADQHQLIVLAHDSGARTQTAAALPQLIEELMARGYEFDKLDTSVEPIRFALP